MTDMKMTLKWSLWLAFSCFTFYTASVMAGAGGSVPVELKVNATITAVGCKVNAGKVISIEFGTIPIDKVLQATANLPVTITCDSSPSGTAQIEVKAETASFSATMLKTDVSGLAIQLLYNSTQIDPNTVYDTKTFGLTGSTGTFNLTANLVTDGKTTLNGGEFNASATLILQMS